MLICKQCKRAHPENHFVGTRGELTKQCLACRAAGRESYVKRRKQKVCELCPAVILELRHSLCPECRVKFCNNKKCRSPLKPGSKRPACNQCQAERSAAWVAKIGITEYRKRRSAQQVALYHSDPVRHREAARNFRRQLREEFLAAYGGKCTCCGESEKAFLTLEHKRRDGKAHRSALSKGQNNSWAYAVYADLRRRGWPKDHYTLLCFNCNHASWKLGACPHQAVRPT